MCYADSVFSINYCYVIFVSTKRKKAISSRSENHAHGILAFVYFPRQADLAAVVPDRYRPIIHLCESLKIMLLILCLPLYPQHLYAASFWDAGGKSIYRLHGTSRALMLAFTLSPDCAWDLPSSHARLHFVPMQIAHGSMQKCTRIIIKKIRI